MQIAIAVQSWVDADTTMPTHRLVDLLWSAFYSVDEIRDIVGPEFDEAQLANRPARTYSC